MSATVRGNDDQIELSSSLCEDVVDSSLFHEEKQNGLFGLPKPKGLCEFSLTHCCNDHKNTVWEWVSTGTTPLYKFVFGSNQSYISVSALKHRIPNPVHGNMISFSKRRQTFGDRWPKQMYQIPSELARAGFFYTGEGDKCKTFCCGSFVNQWDHRDEAVEEHQKHAPTCWLPRLLEK